MAIPVGRSRRGFLSTVGLTTAGLTIVPRHVLGRGFQAPSDRLNIAVVGVGGRGRAVITNMVSENLVAMCDVDWGYADQGFANLDTDISKLEDAHRRQLRRGPRAGVGAERGRAAHHHHAADDTPRADARDRAGRPAEGARHRGAEGRPPPGLPADARPAEGHRRGGRGHARSPARRRRARRDGPRQARLRREAALLVGGRGATARQACRRDEGHDADGQSGPLDSTMGARPWSTSRLARLAK